MRIERLIDYPQFLTQVADWNNSEWPSYFDGDIEKAVAFYSTTMTREHVPICLVAVDQGSLVGTVSLVPEDLDSRPEFSPWLSGLYVDPTFRGQGIAKKLIEACTAEAQAAGVAKLYVWTKELRTLFESVGWNFLEVIEFQQELADLLTKDLR
ncbi:MAG: hypothetical protein RIS36_1592 [Pseudomonadota bacterium]